MKKLLFIFVALSTLALNNVNASEEGAYAQVIGGANWANVNKSNFKPCKIDLKTGYLLGGSLGYRFDNGLRFEGEYSYRQNKFKAKAKIGDETVTVKSSSHGKIRFSALLANILWDLPLGDCGFTTYVGGGAGYSWNKCTVGNIKISKDDAVLVTKHADKNANRGFAYQAIAGVSVPVTCNVDLGLEYRYFRTTKHVRNHDLVLASKYNF